MSMRLEEFMKQDKILDILATHEEARSITQQIENAILGHKIHSVDVSYQAGAMVTCLVFRFEENDAYVTIVNFWPIYLGHGPLLISDMGQTFR